MQMEALYIPNFHKFKGKQFRTNSIDCQMWGCGMHGIRVMNERCNPPAIRWRWILCDSSYNSHFTASLWDSSCLLMRFAPSVRVFLFRLLQYFGIGVFSFLNRKGGQEVRYVGVIWSVSHVLQLLPIRFTQVNLYCISKFMTKHP